MKGGRSKVDKRGTDNKLKTKGARASKRTAKEKAAKDSNKPKRPPSAFFVFVEEFRKQFIEAHPNNNLWLLGAGDFKAAEFGGISYGYVIHGYCL